MPTHKSLFVFLCSVKTLVISDAAIDKLPSLLVKQKSEIKIVTVESLHSRMANDKMSSILVKLALHLFWVEAK